MKDWIPKVGDLVTPDMDALYGLRSTSAHALRGGVYKVTKVRPNSEDMTVDGDCGSYGNDKWLYKYWMPAKNAIVHSILKDL